MGAGRWQNAAGYVLMAALWTSVFLLLLLVGCPSGAAAPPPPPIKVPKAILFKWQIAGLPPLPDCAALPANSSNTGPTTAVPTAMCVHYVLMDYTSGAVVANPPINATSYRLTKPLPTTWPHEYTLLTEVVDNDGAVHRSVNNALVVVVLR